MRPTRETDQQTVHPRNEQLTPSLQHAVRDETSKTLSQARLCLPSHQLPDSLQLWSMVRVEGKIHCSVLSCEMVNEPPYAANQRPRAVVLYSYSHYSYISDIRWGIVDHQHLRWSSCWSEQAGWINLRQGANFLSGTYSNQTLLMSLVLGTSRLTDENDGVPKATNDKKILCPVRKIKMRGPTKNALASLSPA